jgi:hypothetical protein
LANHPTKWDSGQAVSRAILNRSSADVYKTISEPYILRRDNENITAVTPGKPNFLMISRVPVVVVVVVVFLIIGVHFTLVMGKPFVKVRVPLI